MKMERTRMILKYILTFFCVLAILTGALVFVAKIPQAKVKENMYRSASYLCEREVFFCVLEDVPSTMIDRYADSILLGIAYQYDSEEPFSSVAWSSYYANPSTNENENLYVAVTEEKEANQQYLRYWHGSNIFVKVFHLFTDIRGLYCCNAFVIVVLYFMLCKILFQKKAYVPIAGITISLIATGVWLVPFSLEYTWNYIVMLAMSAIGVVLSYRKKWELLGLCFMITGMVTNYLDFLTSETLTLTIPLLLVLWTRDDDVTFAKKDSLIFVGKHAFVWGIGYVGMWIAKWIFASIVLRENVMLYVTQHIGERLDGEVGLYLPQYLFGAIIRNVRCLFPLDYGVCGLFVGLLIACFAIYLGYVHYGKKEDKRLIISYLFIAAVPYIRYAILHNHAYIHYFFTYRAQGATVLAMIFILELLTDRRWLVHGTSKKRRR